MKRYFYQYLIFLAFYSINSQVHAENLIGGTIDFTYRGGNSFNIKTTVYVDKGVKAASPDLYQGFIKVSIYAKGTTASDDVLMEIFQLNQLSKQDNFPYENQDCVSSITLSTTKIVYSSDIVLNKSIYNNSRGYYLVWQDGNRNTTTNANTPFVGMTLYLTFPALNTQDNSSPVFNLQRGLVACLNAPFSIDLGATDTDPNNTLTYSLVDAYSAGGYSTVAGKQSAPYSRNAYLGSYFPVPWLAGFSAANPIPGTGMSLNSSTGIFIGIPTRIGKYLVVVECKEFRGGVQIGSNRQDFEIIVDDCKNPKPKIYLSGKDPSIHEISTVICEGSFRILETPNNAGFTYVWKKDGVIVAGANKNQLKVLYKDAGKYTVTVTRTGVCAGTATSLETELRPQAGENVKLTVTDSTVCSDAVPVILVIEQNSTGTARNNFRKEWYLNNVTIPNVYSQSYPVSVSGKYKVIVTDFTVGGSNCTYEASKEIIVTPVPNPTITNVTGKTAVCQGDIVKLSITPIDTGVIYYWVRNSVDIATATSLEVNSSGTYTVRAQSTVNANCVKYAPTTVTIAVNPYPTVIFDDIKPICASKSAKIDLRNYVSPYDATLGVFTGTGVRGYEFDPTISGYGSFPIKYAYTTTAGCRKDTSKTAVVDLIPFVKLGDSFTIFRGDAVRIKSVGSTGSKYLYEWTPTTSLSSPNVPQPIANPDVTTEYVVKVSSLLSKCFATDKIIITVRSVLKIPLAFTPNSDTINDTWVIMDNNREFNDYPDIEVQIFNRWGDEIFYSIGSGSYQTKPFDGIKDGQRLPAGTYFYVIKPSPDVPSLTGYVTIVR